MAKNLVFKFCGGCNPRIDRLELKGKLCEELIKAGWELSEKDAGEVRLLIIINGCSTACAKNDQGESRFISIVVAGESVNSHPTLEEDICNRILNLISCEGRNYEDQHWTGI